MMNKHQRCSSAFLLYDFGSVRRRTNLDKGVRNEGDLAHLWFGFRLWLVDTDDVADRENFV